MEDLRVVCDKMREDPGTRVKALELWEDAVLNFVNREPQDRGGAARGTFGGGIGDTNEGAQAGGPNDHNVVDGHFGGAGLAAGAASP